MINRWHFDFGPLRLLLLCFTLIIGLLAINPKEASAFPLKFEGISSRVVAVNGNIVQLEGGFSADISEAQFQGSLGEPASRPEIHVGDLAKIFGVVASNPGEPVLIKAASANFGTGREFYYTGLVQATNAAQNTITVLNKDVRMAADAVLMNSKGKTVKLKSFKPNDMIDMNGMALDTGIVANYLLKIKFPDGPSAQITGFVKSLNGSIMELEGGFLFDLKLILATPGSEFDILKDPNNFRPGTEVLIGLLEKTAMALPKGAIKVDGAFGFSRGPITIDANLQAVDPVARTITVLNRTISIPENAYIEGPRGKTDLSKLVIGQAITIFANRGGAELAVTLVNQVFIN